MVKKICVLILIISGLFRSSYGILDEKQIVKVAESLKQSVVYVKISGKVYLEKGEDFPQTFTKNGLILDTTGHILTSFISPELMLNIEVFVVVPLGTGQIRKYPAKLVGSDKVARISVLKINPDVEDVADALQGEELVPGTLTGTSRLVNNQADKIKPGEWLVGVYSLSEEYQCKKMFCYDMVEGIIPAGIHNILYMGKLRLFDGMPLVNLSGEVVSIVLPFFRFGMRSIETKQTKITKEIDMMRAGLRSVHIGPIIPAIEQIIKTQESAKISWIGIMVKKLTEESAEGFNVPHQGVLVTKVFKGFPAEKSGLQANDIVLEIETKKIPQDNIGVRLLVDMIRKHEPDKPMTMKILRGAEEKILTVIPIELPEHKKIKNAWLGMTVQEINDISYSELNLFVKKGVLIADIEPGGPANQAKLHVGDVVFEIDNVAINNLADWQTKLYELERKKVDSLLLRLYRGNQSLIRVIRPTIGAKHK